MGHLTRIANHVVEHMEKGSNADRIKDIFQGTGSPVHHFVIPVWFLRVTTIFLSLPWL